MKKETTQLRITHLCKQTEHSWPSYVAVSFQCQYSREVPHTRTVPLTFCTTLIHYHQSALCHFLLPPLIIGKTGQLNHLHSAILHHLTLTFTSPTTLCNSKMMEMYISRKQTQHITINVPQCLEKFAQQSRCLIFSKQVHVCEGHIYIAMCQIQVLTLQLCTNTF